MTGRERLTNILNKKPVDRVCWTTLVDDTTRSGMADNIRQKHPFEFYRSIGCDIMQFGNYGFYGTEDRVYLPWRLITPEIKTEEFMESDGSEVKEQRTKWGALRAILKDGHPVKYPVESIKELRIVKNIWINSFCEEDKSDSFERSLKQMEERIGDRGIYVHTIGPSPVQQFLQYETGVTNFYYLLQDHREEMAEALNVVHNVRLQEYEILARRTPAECVVLVENTSTSMISPKVYEELSLRQISDFVDIMHKHNKKAILHMCGGLKKLLPVIKETGLDGINGVTPPPVGDTSFNDVLDEFGEEFIVLGGIFDPSIFQKREVSKKEIWNALHEIYTPRIRQAHFLLWPGADGIPTPLARFYAIRDWFKENGGL